MKTPLLIALLAVVAISAATKVQGQTNAAIVSSADDQAKQQATLDKHVRPILEALALNDPAKENRVREIFGAYLTSLDSWHAANDQKIKPLWSQFSKARSHQNEAEADAALAKIDDVYASFKPVHDKFITDLSSVLSPAQIETVENVLTVNKVKVTYTNYGLIFPGLTDEQKAFILKNLKDAREEAINAVSMTEKSAFFKKYKIKIEAYLTAQGYDVKQSYRDFVAKQKAEMAAKKGADATDPAN